MLLRQLQRDGFAPKCRRVDTPEAMLAALRSRTWDLVVCDYALPRFSVAEALSLLHGTGQDLPFLIVSGAIGEETVVTAMKAGAHDCLRKDNLVRLGATVERELREARLRREQKAAQRALAESEARHRCIVETASEGLCGLDADFRVTFVNRRMAEMGGYAESDLVGRSVTEFLFTEDLPDHARRIAARRAGQRDRYERRLRRKDGSLCWALVSVTPVLDAQGGFAGAFAMFTDITERRLTEEKARKQADLLDWVQEAIGVTDLEGRLRFWNRGAERLYGWPAAEVLGRQPAEFLYKAGSARPGEVWNRLMQSGQWHGELRQISKTGQEIVVESRWRLLRTAEGAPAEVLFVNTDLTERKLLEARFLRSQRLESIGALAGGIAHDLNNILSPILMAAPLLRLDSMEPGEKDAAVAMIESSAQRAAQVVRQLLSFSRGSRKEPAPVHLAHLIKEMLRLTEETFPKSISTKASVEKGLWPVIGDPTQLHQVLMNLCLNARDAMPQGGWLVLGAANFQLEAAHAAAYRNLPPGPYVRLQVSDTGMGIPAEYLDRVFDPFFTTKTEGTGLGLATVLGIIKGHDGYINVESRPGHGTVFEILLPAAPELRPTVPDTEVIAAPRGHGEQILVVDDEQHVREITQKLLQKYGYQVLTAENGQEALGLFDQHRDTLKAILTDTVMPVMDGEVLIRQLRQRDPQAKIIVISGEEIQHQRERHQRFTQELGVHTVLLKPCPSEQILTVLRDLLGKA